MSYTRRTIIKGISLGAGYSVLSPVLGQLKQSAEGNSDKLPKRFVFVVKSSGIIPETVIPQTLAKKPRNKDQAINISLKDQLLEPAMKPLEPLKEYLSIIQGISGKMCAPGHSSNYGSLGAWFSSGEGSTAAPKRATVDSILSKMFPAAINHLATGLTGNWGTRLTEGVVYPLISAAGAGKTIPFQTSPDIVFEQLFGTVASNDKYSAKKLASKRNLLDFLSDDVKKMKSGLPATEKAKLDHYLDTLENLGDQDVKIAALRESLEKNVPEFSEKYTTPVIEQRQEAHFDLLAAALISGITNVATMKIDNSATFYTGLGLSEKSVHGIGHNESCNGNDGLQSREVIRRHHFEILASLANKLKAVPEGDGNMLDNTMIIYISPSGNKHHGTLEEWPIVVLGGCSGKLKIPGRYLQFPAHGQKNHKTLGNWWTSVLNAYGNQTEHYGDFDPNLMKGGFDQKGPITELIA